MKEDFIHEVTPRERAGVDSSIVAIKSEIADSPDDPQLYRDLAVAYRLKGTPRSRLLSLEAVNRALDIEPMNPANYIQRGLTYHARGFIGEAMKDFKQAVSFDPECFQGWYQLGRLEYNEYIKTLCYNNHLKKAISYFRKAHRLNREDKNTLYRLSFLLMFRHMYLTAIKYGRKAEIYHPDDYRIHLLLGTLYLKSSQFREARSEFREAFRMMNQSQLAPYLDISKLLDPSSAELWETTSLPGREEWRRKFWVENDPTPSTEINERKLEHFSRVFLAEMLFDDPKLGLNGEETDMGETLISYGYPYKKQYDLQGGHSGGWIAWVYKMENGYITLYFHDEFLNGNFHFPISDHRGEQSAKLLKQIPHMYEYPIKYQRLPVKAEIAQSRGDRGLTRLEFSIAIPEIHLKNLSDSSRVFVTFFDFEMRRYAREFFKLNPGNLEGLEGPAGSFRIRNFWIELTPREMESLCAIEIVDNKTRYKGSARIPMIIDEFYGDRLKVSSIKLTIPGDHNSCTSILNPIPNYQIAQPVCVTYHIYNLKRDASNTSRYRITYQIKNPPGRQYQSGIRRTLSYMWSSIKGDDQEDKPYVSSSIEQSGKLTNTRDSLKIDISALEPGRYQLVLKIEDLVSGDTQSRNRIFFISAKEE